MLPNIDLNTQKKLVVDSIAALDRPIVIIIDDLDRLPSDELRSMVQAVKAVADFPRVTYLLAYDSENVARNLDPYQDEAKGRSYLEKIVQISYPIPPLFKWQQRGFATNEINKLLTRHNIKQQAFELNIFQSAISIVISIAQHPRDIIRLINRLTISLPATRDEINICDVIVFEAITQKFPALRKIILENPEIFIGFRFNGDEDFNTEEDWTSFVREKEEDSSDAWKKTFPVNAIDDQKLSKAFRFIFPYIYRIRGHNAPQHRRISLPDRLSLFFSLTAIDGIPSIVELNKLLNDPSKFESIFESDKEEFLTSLKWITQYINSMQVDEIENKILFFIKLCLLQIEDENISFKALNVYENLLLGLIKHANKESRLDLIILTIDRAPLSITERFAISAALHTGRFNIDENISGIGSWSALVDESQSTEVVQKWITKVSDAALNDKLTVEPNLIVVLYRWMQLTSAKAEVLLEARSVCSTKIGLEKFISGCENGRGPFTLNRNTLIWDARELAAKIEQDDELRLSHSEYLTFLQSPEVLQQIDERNEIREISKAG
jgi:hypothetical protein